MIMSNRCLSEAQPQGERAARTAAYWWWGPVALVRGHGVIVAALFDVRKTRTVVSRDACRPRELWSGKYSPKDNIRSQVHGLNAVCRSCSI
jgi:hypothetical protein